MKNQVKSPLQILVEILVIIVVNTVKILIPSWWAPVRIILIPSNNVLYKPNWFYNRFNCGRYNIILYY